MFLVPVLPHQLGADGIQKLLHVVNVIFIVAALCLRKARINRSYIFYVTILALGLTSYYVSCSLLFSRELSLRDIGDYSRPFIYAIYTLLVFAFPLSCLQMEKILRFLFFVAFFQIVFSALVHLPPLWSLVDLYKGRPSTDMALHFYRWSGTFGYPSDFSFYLSFFVFYYYGSYSRGVMTGGRWLAAMIFICAMLMTFSRGGIFATVGVLGVAFFFMRASRKLSSYVLLIIVSLILTFLYMAFGSSFEQLEYMSSVIGGEDGEVDGSTAHRFRELSLALEYGMKYFPFGAGANRVELQERISVVESFYGFHLIKWGWLGLLIAVGIKVTIIFFCHRVMRFYFLSNVTASLFAFSVMLLTFSELLFFGFSSAVTDRFKGLPFYYVLVGYIIYFYSISRFKKAS